MSAAGWRGRSGAPQPRVALTPLSRLCPQSISAPVYTQKRTRATDKASQVCEPPVESRCKAARGRNASKGRCGGEGGNVGVRGSIRSERPARVLGTLGARPRVNHLRPVQARNIGLCLPSRVAERSLACADAPLSALRVAGVGVCQLRLAACHDLGRLHPAHLLPTLAAGSALQHYAVNPPVAPSLSKQECVVTPQGSMCGGGGCRR